MAVYLRSSGVAAILAVCVCAGVSAKSIRTQSDKLLWKAVKAIRSQEQALKNIRFNFISKGWTRNTSKANMVWAGSIQGVAIYDGLPWGKCRLDVHHDVSLAVDSPAPYYVEAYSVAYNGRVGTFLQTLTGLQNTAAGTPTRVWPLNVGHISGHRSGMIQDGQTGWADSLFGFTSVNQFNMHPRFSAYITPGQKKVTLHARWIDLGGRRYLRVTHIYAEKSVFLLNPRKGYSITTDDSYYNIVHIDKTTGKIHGRPGTWIYGEFHVKSFFEPLLGVYYPKQIQYKGFEPHSKGGQEKLWDRGSIVISKVRVNDPKVNDATYVVRFPRNAIVTDTATNKTIRIGGTPRQQLKAIEKAVNQARKAIATEPAASRP